MNTLKAFLARKKVKAALARAGRSAAQAALLASGGAVVGAQVDAFDIDLQAVAGLSLGMAAMSLLTSIVAGLPEAED